MTRNRKIKNGRDASARKRKPKRYKCADCKSVLEVSREDMGHMSSDRDGDYYTFRCPVCNQETFVDARVVENGGG